MCTPIATFLLCTGVFIRRMWVMEVTTFTSCPRCTEAVQPEEVVVCRNCGWMPSALETKQELHQQKRLLIIYSIFGAFLITAFVHIINWDKYSVEIVPLKAKLILGKTDAQDLTRIAEICSSRFKYQCSETALSDLAYRYNDGEAFMKLGLLQRKLRNWTGAAKSYELALSLFEKTSSKDPNMVADIYYGLAKSFENLGNVALAVDYYDQAIKAKPGVIQITVTEDYVTFLKKIGDLKAAKKVVAEAQKRSGSKTLFAALAI
jgi:tetratricopeptide (TPR) repeat protein